MKRALYNISSRFWDNGDAVYLWYDLQKCIVLEAVSLKL